MSILYVLIFPGLTAWDTQSIKRMYCSGDGYEIAKKSGSTARCASTSTSSTCSRRS